MNRAFFLILALLFIGTGNLFGQGHPTDKGSMSIGGWGFIQSKGGDLYETSNGERSININLLPGFRYFVFSSIALGLDFAYMRDSHGTGSSTTLGGGPSLIVCNILGSQENKIIPYIGAGFLYLHNKEIAEQNGTDLRFVDGLMIMVSRNLALGMEISYHIQSLKNEHPDKILRGNVFQFMIGVTGFIY